MSDSNVLVRLSTGNAGADAILGGGFPSNSINLILGAPGTGKTLFTQQLALANADSERPVLYLTTLSEPLAKLITYLQQLSFYDEAKIGTGVRYEALGPELVERGAPAMMSRLREAIKELSPKVIIIDSFKAVHDLVPTPMDMRLLVADMAGLLTAYDATTFLVGEYDERDIARFPEFAVADSIIEFARHKSTTRDERYVRVSKLRGSPYREGLHGFRITAGGLEFFPRLISPELSREYTASNQRISTGNPGLDAMVGGGLWRGTSTLVAGPTGSGKTTFSVQFCLEGIRTGEPVLYLNFQENPTQLGRLVSSLGGSMNDERWHAIYLSPVELQIDSLIGEMFQLINQAGVRRLVVDGVGDLLLAAGDSQRVHDYLYALTQHLARHELSSVLTLETGMGARNHSHHLTDQVRVSGITDTILLLDIEASDRLRRSVCVLKARNSTHELAIRELSITGAGLQVK